MTDSVTPHYVIHTDVKFGPLEKVDAGKIGADCPEKWWNQSLLRVNDCVARLGVFDGEFHWHKHDREDEIFFVLEGQLFVDIEGKDPVVLDVHQCVLVPKGVVHRTRAPKRTVVLMIEAASIVPTGD